MRTVPLDGRTAIAARRRSAAQIEKTRLWGATISLGDQPIAGRSLQLFTQRGYHNLGDRPIAGRSLQLITLLKIGNSKQWSTRIFLLEFCKPPATAVKIAAIGVYRHHLTWIVSKASLLWLGVLLALTLSDYLSRGWLDIPGK